MNKRKMIIAIVMIIVIVLACMVIPGIIRKAKIEAQWKQHVAKYSVFYDVRVEKRDIKSGTLRLTLDNNKYTYDYVCEVRPFGLDSGYGPFCEMKFEDGSWKLGQYLWNVNKEKITGLLAKYEDAIMVDNTEWIFVVKDEERLKDFFAEYVAIPDLKKVYDICRKTALIEDGLVRSDTNMCPEYMYVRNVKIGNVKYGGIGLFDWALANNL